MERHYDSFKGEAMLLIEQIASSQYVQRFLHNIGICASNARAARIKTNFS